MIEHIVHHIVFNTLHLFIICVLTQCIAVYPFLLAAGGGPQAHKEKQAVRCVQALSGKWGVWCDMWGWVGQFYLLARRQLPSSSAQRYTE